MVPSVPSPCIIPSRFEWWEPVNSSYHSPDSIALYGKGIFVVTNAANKLIVSWEGLIPLVIKSRFIYFF